MYTCVHVYVYVSLKTIKTPSNFTIPLLTHTAQRQSKIHKLFVGHARPPTIITREQHHPALTTNLDHDTMQPHRHTHADTHAHTHTHTHTHMNTQHHPALNTNLDPTPCNLTDTHTQTHMHRHTHMNTHTHIYTHSTTPPAARACSIASGIQRACRSAWCV